ncbi:unnamed protein product, partial [Ectocarpus sp. 8 AP-2014]
SSGGLSASKTIQIIVDAINDGPSLTGPLAIEAEEDTPIAVNGVAVQDPDCDDALRGVLEITVAASNGTVQFIGSVAGLYLMEALPGSLKVRGKTGPVNAALAGLSYEGVAEFSGTDRIVVTADDLGHSGTGSQLSASWSIEVLVSASNDPPLIQAPPELDLIAGGVLFVVEDEPSPLGVFGVSDIDDAFLRVTVSARVGNVDETPSATGSSVSFEGTADEVSDALGSLTYTSSLNWNSVAYGRDVVSVEAWDYSPAASLKGGYVSFSFEVHVSQANDAPSIQGPTGNTWAGQEDSKIPLSNGGGIVLHDPDSSDSDGDLMEVKIVVEVGKLFLPLSVAGGLYLLNGDHPEGSHEVWARGGLLELNRALQGLKYQAPEEWNGVDEVQVWVSDLGGHQQGQVALESSALFFVAVDAVADTPKL